MENRKNNVSFSDLSLMDQSLTDILNEVLSICDEKEFRNRERIFSEIRDILFTSEKFMENTSKEMRNDIINFCDDIKLILDKVNEYRSRLKSN